LDVLLDSKEKIRSALSLIAELEGVQFPHDDAPNALARLKNVLSNDFKDLDDLDDSADPSVIRSNCVRSTSDIADTLEFLGFIVNSTSIRNSFEVHKSLLDIAKSLVHPQIKLLLSFEWDYVPFTYPLNFPYLSDFVVIGLPASEASNALILPAAGHELGHSIWRNERMTQVLKQAIQDTVKETIVDRHWGDFLNHIDANIIRKPDDLDSLMGKDYWARAYNWSLSQIEETFCDFVGLNIFGSAYLHAFSYLLAPRFGNIRAEVYPDLKTRARNIERAASKLHISALPEFVDRFDSQPPPFAKGQFSYLMLQVADQTLEQLFERVFDASKERCTNCGIEPPKEHEWVDIVQKLNSHVPASECKSLAHIINAGWSVSRDSTAMDKLLGADQRRLVTLNELLLKSIEVFEIENLLSEPSK